MFLLLLALIKLISLFIYIKYIIINLSLKGVAIIVIDLIVSAKTLLVIILMRKNGNFSF
jgi:hypothetical protein